MILLSLSCYPQPTAQVETVAFDINEAEITEVSALCEEDKWTFTVDTDAWTSNGTVWLAQGLHRYERHPLYSVGAAEDGSSDSLQLTLSVLPDWRDFVAGESTGWLCSEQDEFSVAIMVYHGESNQPSDCIYWGEDIWGDFPSIDECDLWYALD